MSHSEYASSPQFRHAVSRAQWAVIQTGLITSGLALFGVYVLATRVNDMHLMSMYVMEWIPIGPLLVGLIAGSGYILASWWFGVRVGAALVAGILLLQLALFMACHYADFETLNLIYRDTGEPVGFWRYFQYTTERLGLVGWDESAGAPPPRIRGYAIRAAEAGCFVTGGLLAALTLVGRPKCALCGGLVRRRTLGKVGGPRGGETLKRLQERARLRDARGFHRLLAAQAEDASQDESAVELTVRRCDVCGVGAIEQSAPPAGAATAAAAAAAAAASAAASWRSPGLTWAVEVRDDFARMLFENPRLEPVPGGDATSRP